MMTLKDAREYYSYFTGKTSDIIRQLGLGGIALIWLFKIDVSGSQSKLPSEFSHPLALITFGLAIDLLHYFIAASIWGIFQRKMEKSNIGLAEFSAPNWFNWPGIFCFVVKFLAITAAYILLIRHLWKMIF